MKRNIIILLLLIGMFFTNQINVFAKDSIFSINKYQEESLNIIKDSYNDVHKKDGLLVGGFYLKEPVEKDDNTYNDYQIFVGKYNYQGKLLWQYSYGKTKEDYIDEIVYTYDELGNIDGYGIILEKTYDIGEKIEDNTSATTILKIDLDGKLAWEKSGSINKKERITKLFPILKEDKTFDYYIGIGNVTVDNNEKAMIVKYDRDFNLLWEKEMDNTKYVDFIPILEEGRVSSFACIQEKQGENQTTASIVKYDRDGNIINTVLEGIEKYDSYYLAEADNGFLLYGVTSEVKLNKGEKSYYLIKYDLNNQEEWESIGEFPIDKDKGIHLLPKKSSQGIHHYFLEYINPVDSSMEVLELNAVGTFQKKLKKISADYYTIENFLVHKSTLYFVGQINCPTDDTCDYDSNSLFLISDEDKVIEVKDSDSQNILVITFAIVFCLVGFIFIKSRKKSLSS